MKTAIALLHVCFAILVIGCGKSEPDLDDSKAVDKLLEGPP